MDDDNEDDDYDDDDGLTDTEQKTMALIYRQETKVAFN